MPLDVAVVQYQRTQLQPAIAPELAVRLPVNLAASTSYAAGQLVGELTATPGTFKPYASGNSDGSQNPKAIVPFQCVTDASGNIFMGAQASSEFGESWKSVGAFFGGYFKAADLVGLDATALTNGLGKLIKGTISTGIIKLP